MASEIAHHLECEANELQRQGLSPDAARRQALAAFGGIERIKEDGRDARGTRLVEDAAADLKYGLRMLRRTPGPTAASIVTLGVGVGIATTIFSAGYGVLLRPLPFVHPDRLVAVWERDVRHNRDRNVVSLDNFDAWVHRARSIDDWAALMPVSVTVTDRGEPERVIGADVSYGYFHLLGVTPALGRDFEAADALTGAATILSDTYWKRRYGGDPSIVGRLSTISGKPYRIVGVMPPLFEPPRFGWLVAQAMWFPMVEAPQKRSWGRFLLTVGRLRDGATVDQARAEMRAIAAQRAHETTDDAGWSASVFPLKAEITGDARTTLLVLLGAVSLLLAMAIANVATLTASAMERRSAELAVRRALGATDRRLFRQLVVQSALLSVFGAAAGLAIAAAGVPALVALLPPETPRLASIRIDTPVLAAVTLVAVIATLAFGTLSARTSRRIDDRSLTQGAGSARSTGRSSGSALVVLEIAIALVLGVMSMLMARTLIRLGGVDLGFNPAGVVAARLALPSISYASDAAEKAFFDQLMMRVRASPIVAEAGVISTRPLGGLGPATTVTNPRVPASEKGPAPIADVRYADGPVFGALGVSLVAGRVFGLQDASGPPTVVITRDLADALWPRGDAVGSKLQIDMYNSLTADIVGVVGSIHVMDARTPIRPVVFLSADRFPSTVRDIVIRSAVAPSVVVPMLREMTARIDPSLPLYAVQTLPGLVGETRSSDRFTTIVLAAFAAAALLLAAVGVFGVFAADVVRRRKEIGIRLALGARANAVVALVVALALRRALTGVAAGTIVAILAGQTMKTLLYGVAPDDPVSLGVVALLVLAVAMVATLIPSVRALRRSPLAALREG